jgi:hypothetical protein
MNKRKREEKGRLSPFVPYLKESMREPAWIVMSLGARLLYLHIKARYNIQSHNNGKLYLPRRTAVQELATSPNQVSRWFRELQHYGWIVMMDGGCLGVDGRGRAPRWRLTELGYMNDPPTRDYARWQGDLFVDQKSRDKKQNPGTESRTRVVREVVPPAVRKVVPLSSPSGTESRTKGNDLSGTESRTKSSLTTGVARAGSELAGSRERGAEHADGDAVPPPVSVQSKKRAA